MNWEAKRKKAAKQIVFDPSKLEPVKLDLSHAKNAMILSEIVKLLWMNRNQLSSGYFESYKRIPLYRRLSPFVRKFAKACVANVSANFRPATLAYLDDVAGVPGFEGDHIALLTEASLRETPDFGARYFVRELVVGDTEAYRLNLH